VGSCKWCAESDKPGYVEKRDPKPPRLLRWYPCPRCGGSRQEQSVPLYKAKAS
jgi:hypothetical protein